MSIDIMGDVNGDNLTIFANSSKLQLSVTQAYELLGRLESTLRQLANDRVVAHRENLIKGAYSE